MFTCARTTSTQARVRAASIQTSRGPTARLLLQRNQRARRNDGLERYQLTALNDPLFVEHSDIDLIAGFQAGQTARGEPGGIDHRESDASARFDLIGHVHWPQTE